MKNSSLNLFIIDEDLSMAKSLQDYLLKRFGNNLEISTYRNGSTAIRNVNEETGVVVLDCNLHPEDRNVVIESIKKINPKTEIILFSSHDEIGCAIDTYRGTTPDHVIEGKNKWQKISGVVNQIITYPVRVMVKEFGINKYLAIFLLTFVAVGILVVLTMQYW